MPSQAWNSQDLPRIFLPGRLPHSQSTSPPWMGRWALFWSVSMDGVDGLLCGNLHLHERLVNSPAQSKGSVQAVPWAAVEEGLTVSLVGPDKQRLSAHAGIVSEYVKPGLLHHRCGLHAKSSMRVVPAFDSRCFAHCWHPSLLQIVCCQHKAVATRVFWLDSGEQPDGRTVYVLLQSAVLTSTWIQWYLRTMKQLSAVSSSSPTQSAWLGATR